jgi:hypothetical protein
MDDDIIPTNVDGGGGSDKNPERRMTTGQQHQPPPKQHRHVFRRHTKKPDQNGVIHHPFLVDPDEKEIVMYRCLLVHQPFATTKWKGVTEAWLAAVETINQQRHGTTGRLFFDPPVPVKTVRERFEGAMKIVQEMVDANGPLSFRHGEKIDDDDNDEEETEEPNQLLQILKEIYEQKKTFESGAMIAMTKKQDREVAKAIPEVTIIQGDSGKSSSSSESEDFESDDNSGHQKKKRVKTSESENIESDHKSGNQKKRAKTDDSGEKKTRSVSMMMIAERLASLAAAMAERRAARKRNQQWKQRLAEEHMQMKRQQSQQQMKWQQQQMQQQVELHQQQMKLQQQQMQMQFYEKMMTMMDVMMKKTC